MTSQLSNPKTEYICAIDPGETTGVCWAVRTSAKGFTLRGVEDITQDRVYEDLVQHLHGHAFHTIVMEEFRLYHASRVNKVNSDFPTVQLIGAIKYQLWSHEHTTLEPQPTLIMQPASVMKQIQILPQDEPQLKGLHHARSAYRHLRYYILKTRRNW